MTKTKQNKPSNNKQNKMLKNQNNDKKKRNKIDQRVSIYMRVLHQEANISIKKLHKRFPQHSLRSIYRHAKHCGKVDKVDRRKNNKGRPKKLTIRDERNILRTLNRLRQETCSFTAKRIQQEANLEHVSSRSVRRILKKYGYKYCQSRKKGLLSIKDKKARLEFAKNTLSFDKTFWTEDICFYLDGVGFAHKTNPLGEARAPGGMTWRKPQEGLTITTKGKKEGSNGKMANFFVAIAYNKGVVMCKQYPWTVTGERFAKFIENVFPQTFDTCGHSSPVGQYFLQDGDPRQTSVAAQKAWQSLGCDMFSIPARSPDLNPIENIFNTVRKQLRNEVLAQQITNESYNQFSKRVAKTLKNFPVEQINKTIESMPNRLKMVVKGKGNRTKY